MRTNIETKSLKKRSATGWRAIFFIVPILMLKANVTFAHCDTMDGPVVRDARLAFENNNVNYVLKWVGRQDEAEVQEAFALTMKVRKLGPDAQTLADRWFFETLVRLHRSGEGVPYTGVKPSGTPVDERILAADRSIDLGDLSPLKGLVAEEKLPELGERFKRVISLKDFNINDMEAGREYIEAYVQFFKFAEGEEDGHNEAHASH